MLFRGAALTVNPPLSVTARPARRLCLCLSRLTAACRNPALTVRVSGLPAAPAEMPAYEELHAFFGAVAAVKKVHVARSGRSAFVRCATVEDATKALALNGADLRGSALEVVAQ